MQPCVCASVALIFFCFLHQIYLYCPSVSLCLTHSLALSHSVTFAAVYVRPYLSTTNRSKVVKYSNFMAMKARARARSMHDAYVAVFINKIVDILVFAVADVVVVVVVRKVDFKYLEKLVTQ